VVAGVPAGAEEVSSPVAIAQSEGAR